MLEDRSPLTVAGAVGASGHPGGFPRRFRPYPIPVSLRMPWQPEHRSHAQQAPNTSVLSSNPAGETRRPFPERRVLRVRFWPQWPGWALPEAPRPSTVNFTGTLPAFSKVSVPSTEVPSLSGDFRSRNMMW